jgi:hypothetical protein
MFKGELGVPTWLVVKLTSPFTTSVPVPLIVVTLPKSKLLLTYKTPLGLEVKSNVVAVVEIVTLLPAAKVV